MYSKLFRNTKYYHTIFLRAPIFNKIDFAPSNSKLKSKNFEALKSS